MEPIDDFRRQRLKTQQTHLHSEWDSRTQKLAALRQARVVETSADRLFQLEQQIQEEEEQIEHLDKGLRKIEQALKSSIALPSSQSCPDNEATMSDVPAMSPVFCQLVDLLKEENWEAANAETHRLMLAISQKDQMWQLDKRVLIGFPCDAFQQIDCLWLQYSEERFGFSTQREVLRECCGSFDWLNYDRFRNSVGWNTKKSRHQQHRSSYSIPRGYFPTPPKFFNFRNILIGCLVYPVVISILISAILLLLKQPIVFAILLLMIGFGTAAFSFMIFTSSNLADLKWITLLVYKLETCKRYQLMNNQHNEHCQSII
jgi:hypothetical protein